MAFGCASPSPLCPRLSRAPRQLRCGGHPSATLTRIFDIVQDELGSVNYDQFFNYDGSGAAGISIYQSPDANALSTTAAVVAKMKAPSASIPRGFVYKIMLDTTVFVSRSTRCTRRWSRRASSSCW